MGEFARDNTVERSAERGVAQHDFRFAHHGLSAGETVFEAADHLGGAGVFRKERTLAVEIAAGGVELRLGLGDAGVDLAGRNFHEEIAGGDALAERRGKLVDGAHDLRGELGALERADRAGDLGGGRKIFGAHGGDADFGDGERGGSIGGRGRSGVFVTTGEEGERGSRREGGDSRERKAAGGLHGENKIRIRGAA